jgi:formylglycine-generating enzyme required for sulfatase activity/nucleoside phosphorylase
MQNDHATQRSDRTDFLVAAAMPSEYKAFVSNLSRYWVEGSDTVACVPRLNSSESYRIAVIVAGQTTAVAQAAVSEAIIRCRPRAVILVGIAAGFPENGVDLGDIIVPFRIAPYEYVKISEQAPGIGIPAPDATSIRLKYEHRNLPFDVSHSLWTQAAALSRDPEHPWLKRIANSRPVSSKIEPEVHAQDRFVMGSGDKLVASQFAEQRAWLITQFGANAVGLEMEGYGALMACRSRDIPFLLVKAAQDPATAVKDDPVAKDEWRGYSAAAAGAFVLTFIERYRFPTEFADTYGRSLVPYTDKYRDYYFHGAAPSTQTFLDYAAEQILHDLQENEAGPLLLDQVVVDRIFALARGREDEIYGPFRVIPAPPGMVYIPPGEFIRGGSRLGNERLRVDHVLKGFFIGESAVSNKEYREFANYVKQTADHRRCHPAEPKDKNHWPDPDFSGAAAQDVIVSPLPDDYFLNIDYDGFPVVNVDWWDAYAFACWRGCRLPTEAEWEKAARGIDGRAFPYGNTFNPKVSNVADSGVHRPVRLRTFPQGRSPFECYEMSGNVWQWCADPFDPDHPEATTTRVVRGGSCTRGRVKAASSFRNGRNVSDRWLTRGFRCVMDEDAWRGGS